LTITSILLAQVARIFSLTATGAGRALLASNIGICAWFGHFLVIACAASVAGMELR
jgi:hypothetical protein